MLVQMRSPIGPCVGFGGGLLPALVHLGHAVTALPAARTPEVRHFVHQRAEPHARIVPHVAVLAERQQPVPACAGVHVAGAPHDAAVPAVVAAGLLEVHRDGPCLRVRLPQDGTLRQHVAPHNRPAHAVHRQPVAGLRGVHLVKLRHRPLHLRPRVALPRSGPAVARCAARRSHASRPSPPVSRSASR